MRHFCKIHEAERYVYLHVSTHFEQEELDAVHNYGLWDHLLANVTPDSFREQYKYAKQVEQRLDELHAEYQSLPFLGYDLDKDEIKREIAHLQRDFTGIPTHNFFWLVRPARLIENSLLEIPFADYAEVQKAERDISRALTAFARKLQELIPEPEPEPEPEEIPVPVIDLPWLDDELRFAGVWIIAPPRAGKTQTIQALIQRDLERMAHGERLSVFLMDSQGAEAPRILHNLSHLKLFAPGEPLHGKLVYISPRDNPGIPLNIFDLGFPGTPEEKFVATHELITFALTGLMGDEFTPPMRRLITRCVRVLLERPGATLDDLSSLLEDPRDFANEISRAGPRVKSFFSKRVNDQTRDAVLDRIYGIDALPDFERMISHPKTTFSLMDALEEGKVVIVDTSSRSAVATATTGRFFLALIDAVSRARLDVPAHRKTPAFIYIDELGAYCRSHANHFSTIMEACRKQNLSICAAHQYCWQIDADIKSTLRGSAIKLANPEANDAREIADAMGDTHWSFITNRESGVFAFHQTGMSSAELVRVPYPNLGGMEMMGEPEYQRVRREIQDLYPEPEPEPEPEPGPDPVSTPDDPDDDEFEFKG